MDRSVTISDERCVEHVGPLSKVRIENVTSVRDAFWFALLVARLEGKGWPGCVRFPHEVASLKLRVGGLVERLTERYGTYDRLAGRAEQSA